MRRLFEGLEQFKARVVAKQLKARGAGQL